MAATTRAQWLADARALLDFIEANPDLPVNTFRIAASIYNGTDEENRAAVDAVAAILAVEPTTSRHGGHYNAAIEIGSAVYEAYMVPDRTMRRYHQVQDLGEAALTEQEATR